MRIKIHYTKWTFTPSRLSRFDYNRIGHSENDIELALQNHFPKGSFSEEEAETLRLLKKLIVVFSVSLIIGLCLYFIGIKFGYAMIGCWISGGMIIFVSGAELQHTWISYRTYLGIRKRFLKKLKVDILGSIDYEDFCRIRNYPSSVIESQSNTTTGVHMKNKFR